MHLGVALNLVPSLPIVQGGVGFNGVSTARAKAALVQSLGLAGAMVWEAGQDTVEASTSLLATLGVALNTARSHDSSANY